jgi:PAS domain S-box-containing protein
VLVDAEGEIVLVNAQTEKLFGYAREEMLGQSLEMLVATGKDLSIDEYTLAP